MELDSPNYFFYSIPMLNTKSLVATINEVPREWVFEYYLKLNEKLCGQDIKMKSPFNPTDKNPSAYVYYAKGGSCYKFKDFSAGVSGDGVTLIQALFKLTSRGEAAHKIIEDYNQYILTNKEDYSLREFKVYQKYRVTSHVKRGWNNLDQKYWMNYHIGSKLLEEYQIFPLESYTMNKEEDGDLKELHIKGLYIYGYFRKDGTLYKIYQPMVKDNKFIKVKDYIQGTDQLTMKHPYLVICSSMKDILAFKKIGFNNAEAVAPDSENNLIPEHIISAYKLKYKSVCVLFDNDQPGIDSAKKYLDKYGLKNVLLTMSKDLSDSIRDHSITKVREVITPLLKHALNVQSTNASVGASA